MRYCFTKIGDREYLYIYDGREWHGRSQRCVFPLGHFGGVETAWKLGEQITESEARIIITKWGMTA